MVEDKSLGSRLFNCANIVFLLVFSLLTVIPFIYIVAASLTPSEMLLRKGFILFPTRISLDGYRYIFSTGTIIRSLGVTVFITVVGTFFNMLFVCLMTYPLSRRDLDGRRFFLFMVVFTMLFSGGMIPTFLVVKATGLLDSFASLIVPGLIGAFNVIVLKNFFQQLPDGLEEAAKIDGCSDYGLLFRMVLPLSVPALATFSLFHAVGHWNAFFNAILYINDYNKWPIQVWLRQIVIMAQGGVGDSSNFGSDFVVPPPEIIKMAVIVVSTLPILMVYPFLQKHFTKGILLGSVKG